VHVGETDLQIWGCKLYQNAFGGSYSAPPHSLAVVRGAEGREEKERVRNRDGGERR